MSLKLHQDTLVKIALKEGNRFPLVLAGRPHWNTCFPVSCTGCGYSWFLMCIPIQTKSLAVHVLSIDKSPVFSVVQVNDAMSLFLVFCFLIIHVWCFYFDFILHIHDYLGGVFLCVYCIYFSLNSGGNKSPMVWRQSFNKL